VPSTSSGTQVLIVPSTSSGKQVLIIKGF